MIKRVGICSLWALVSVLHLVSFHILGLRWTLCLSSRRSRPVNKTKRGSEPEKWVQVKHKEILWFSFSGNNSLRRNTTKQEESQTTQRAYTQSTLTSYNSLQSASLSVCSARATFGLGSVLISKLFYYDFKEVSQSHLYYEWVPLADGGGRPDWWIYWKWLFSGSLNSLRSWLLHKKHSFPCCPVHMCAEYSSAECPALTSRHLLQTVVVIKSIFKEAFWHFGKCAFYSLTSQILLFQTFLKIHF